MKVGYIRISTAEQNEARQVTMMKESGVEKVFLDKLSGKDRNRPQLEEMLSFIREGDVVIVESFSRLARNPKDLLNIVEEINNKGALFVSLKENVDTSTPTGEFMLTVFGAVAKLERESILQRQAEGIEEAKAAGKYAGRKPINVDEEKLKSVYKKWKDGEITAKKAMEILNLKPNTFYRRIQELSA